MELLPSLWGTCIPHPQGQGRLAILKAGCLSASTYIHFSFLKHLWVHISHISATRWEIRQPGDVIGRLWGIANEKALCKVWSMFLTLSSREHFTWPLAYFITSCLEGRQMLDVISTACYGLGHRKQSHFSQSVLIPHETRSLNFSRGYPVLGVSWPPFTVQK